MTAHIGNSTKQPADDPLIRCRSLCRQTEPPLLPVSAETGLTDTSVSGAEEVSGIMVQMHRGR
jgi:hypothetical protein